MGAVRRERHRLVFVFVILHILFAKGSNLQGVQRIHRPGRKLLQCTTEAACRARCPAGNNVIYLAPQDGTSGQCVCICSPTSSQQNSTPSTRSNSGLIGSSSFAQPLAGGGSGGNGNGNGGIATGGQTTTGTTSPDSGSTESPTTVPAQSSGSGSLGGLFNSASQQGTGSGSNLVGTVQSSGSSSATTTATLVNSATGSGTSGSGGSSTARSSRTPAQSG